VAEQIKVLSVILDQRLTFESHSSGKVVQLYAQEIRHIRHLSI